MTPVFLCLSLNFMSTHHKYIFWAHSPIGYETYLALRHTGILTAENSYLITARDCTPPEANCSIGLPEEYCWMTPAQFELAARKLISFLKSIDFKNNTYELIIPQVANFFIRTLIESPNCKSYIVFDEGRAARGELSKQRCKELFYKYKIRSEASAHKLFQQIGVGFESMFSLYENGVTFYDIKHKKYAGNISFFDDTFPGQNTSILPKIENSDRAICKDFGLILLPPFHVWLKNKDFQNQFLNWQNSIHSIIRLNTEKKWILKFHPHDTDEIKDNFQKLFNFEEFNQFCDRQKISAHREPAFMNFDFYISAPNSTILFLKSERNQYIAIAA